MTDNTIIAIGAAIAGFFLGILLAVLIENWPVTGYGPPPDRRGYKPPPKKRKGSVPKMVEPPPPPERRKSGLPKYEGLEMPPKPEPKTTIIIHIRIK